MNEIKISPEMKKELTKFNLYLRAIMDDNKIHWEFYYDDNEGGFYDMYGPSVNHQYYDQIDLKNHIIEFLTEKVSDLETEQEDLMFNLTSCDLCNGRGSMHVHYSPITATLDYNFYVTQRESHEFENTKSFQEISGMDSWYNTGERLYKKLNDDNFVKQLVEQNGGTTEFEMIYNGYGDSGHIDDTHYSADIETIGYEVIDLFYSGWENNEGSDGTILIDCDEKKVILNHTYYSEEDIFEEGGEIRLV